MHFNQKKEVYYELVEAAATVAASPTKEEGIKNAARYRALYFGRAHIFAIDPAVNAAKVDFYVEMNSVLKSDGFPTNKLDGITLRLSSACKDVLRVQDIFETQQAQ